MSHRIIGHVGLAGALVDPVKRDLSARACNLAAGDLYTFPNASSVVDASQPLTIKWDTSCSMSDQVDVYLYAPASNGLVAPPKTADFSSGELNIKLVPSWWNSTDTATLYVRIINSGEQTFESNVPPGPQFEVQYDPSAATSLGQLTSTASGPTVTSGGNAVMETVASTKPEKGISKGAIAAAVVVPIIVIALLTGIAVRFWRLREAEKRKRWSAAVSTHSGLEWEKGARPGEKPASILGRPSTHYSFRPGSMATSSVYAVENNMAGAGAGGNFPRPSLQMRAHSAENLNSPGVRSSVITTDGNPRQSRISFAETTRPDRRSRMSLGGDLRPVIGKLPGGSRSASDLHTPTSKRSVYATGSAIADDDDDSVNVSPSQLQGPGHFGDADVKRAGQGSRTGRRSFMSMGGGEKRRNSTTSVVSADDFKSAASARGSVDELRDMEAVMLMRRSMMSQKGSPAASAQQEDDAIEALDNEAYAQTMPSAPAPAAQGLSTVAYGPDQMLAVYAARGKVSATPMPAMPAPTNKGMRQMFKNEPAPSAPAPGDMRSYVHLNTGTVSSAAVDALPHPRPPQPQSTGSSLSIPTVGVNKPDARLSGASEISTYSADADVGEAK